MRKIIFIVFLIVATFSGYAINDAPLSLGTKHVIIKRSLNQHHHYYEPIDLPEVIYYEYSSTITVDFGDQPVGNYCVTISSPLVDADYYATSSFTTIPIAVDGINDYNIIIETDDGDIFEGTLLATD